MENRVVRTIGLVGLWDVVAFDEVAGITFKDKDGIQIMKDYMASGLFARGKEEKNANASMVFVGNINQSVEVLIKTSHLFEPFPEAMAGDTAFFDRMHYYIPGWEVPKMRPEFLTNEYGFIVDYLAEFFREMRKRSFSDALDKYFKLLLDLGIFPKPFIMTRANGHCSHFYSFAQHSIHYYKEAKSRGYSERVQLGCLLHDASESYISDLTRPVKRNLPEYFAIEHQNIRL